MAAKFDFGGIATKYGIRCEDGLTLCRGAFRGCDGQKVPLVWNHGHNDVENVIGHAILEEHNDCVYAHCKLNNSSKAQHAKECLANNDLDSLSIFANKLQKVGNDVKHGVIREVSLVVGGCNPGAKIDRISIPMAHGMDPYDMDEDELLDDGAVIYHGMSDTIYSEDDDDYEEEDEEMADMSIEDVYESMTDEQRELCDMIAEQAANDALEEAYDDEDEYYDDEDEYYDDEDEYYDDAEDYDDYEEDYEMKHNVFDDEYFDEPIIGYDDRRQVLADIKTYGSLSESIKHHMVADDGVLAHAITPPNYPHNEDGSTQTYGIADIDWLFPDLRNFNSGAPEFIMRDQGWANKLLAAVHHTPFSRVKMLFADITADEARAKGYIKGNQKYEEVFTLLKRKITPQTVYKKQKFDRDDLVDITDFDAVAWIKTEMRGMLNEELARAILVGDGRSSSYEDKISEDHIKPVYNDADLYSIKVRLPYVANETEDARAKRVIKAAIKARVDYKGSGNPTMYTSPLFHTEMLLLEDSQGYPLYKTDTELATKLRVKEVEEVEILSRVSRTIEVDNANVTYDLAAIIFNPTDYNVGTDRGGEINSFEQFDIDYNQQKYLMETRVSGALVKPKSAIVIEIARA